MPTKTKTKKRAAAGVALTLILLLVAAAAGGLIYWVLVPAVTQRAQPVQPQGSLHALVLDTDAPLWNSADTTEEQMTEYLQQAAVFAQTYGFNALVVPVHTQNGVFYQDAAYAKLPAIEAQQTWYHTYDAMRVLCDAAVEKGVAVYALWDEDALQAADAQQAQDAVKRVEKLYPVTGSLRQSAGADDVREFTYNGAEPQDGKEYLRLYDNGAQATEMLFLAAQQEDFNGALLGGYDEISADLPAYAALLSAVTQPEHTVQPLGYTPPAELAVSYPSQNMKLHTAKTYLMGTSDVSQPLTVNGEAVTARGENGVWGAHIALEPGENTVELVNGGQTQTLTVYYTEETGTSGTPTFTESEFDEQKGVRVTAWINSVLSDPYSDSSVVATARQGACAAADAAVYRNGYYYAFRLTDGNWIRADGTEELDEVPQPAEITAASAQAGVNSEVLVLAGSGTPLVYDSFSGGTLRLTLVNSSFAEGFAVNGSALVQQAETENKDDGTAVLTLKFNGEVQGYSVEYADGQVALHLKKAATRSSVYAKPLTGVTVMLDAGHGGTDTGAMGAAGANAPTEKDVNLAVALAARYRLEQMGATVIMTREGDSFPSLLERLQMIAQYEPDYFIAVHHNSTTLVEDTSGAMGVECYYFYDGCGPLADALVSNMCGRLGRANRGVFGGYRYYVTRTTLCPAVLLECGFMPCPTEYEDIINDRQILRAGNAVAQAVLDATPQGDGAAVPAPPLPKPQEPADSSASDSVSSDVSATLGESGDAPQHPLA